MRKTKSTVLILLGACLASGPSARSEQPSRSAAATASAERTLEFPADRSLGKLKYYDFEKSSWKELGDAKGSVKVPGGKPLVLALSSVGVSDLSPLGKLPPDAFDQLAFDGLKVDDAQLTHLKGLTGLHKLSLREAQISDAALSQLEPLKSLTEVDLSLTAIGDAGVAHLRGLTNLETLDISATQVTNEAVKTLKEMKSLRYLDPQKTKIDQKGLEEIKEALPECIVVER